MNTPRDATVEQARSIKNNRAMVELLSLILDSYVLVGNVTRQPPECEHAAKQEAHEYLVFTQVRVCTLSGEWPPLQDCLNSEIACRAAWLPQFRAGKSLTEAIRERA